MGDGNAGWPPQLGAIGWNLPERNILCGARANICGSWWPHGPAPGSSAALPCFITALSAQGVGPDTAPRPAAPKVPGHGPKGQDVVPGQPWPDTCGTVRRSASRGSRAAAALGHEQMGTGSRSLQCWDGEAAARDPLLVSTDGYSFCPPHAVQPWPKGQRAPCSPVPWVGPPVRAPAGMDQGEFGVESCCFGEQLLSEQWLWAAVPVVPEHRVWQGPGPGAWWVVLHSDTCGVLRPGGMPGCESRSRGGKGRRNGERLQRALCCSHPLHRACALTWFPGAHGPPL